MRRFKTRAPQKQNWDQNFRLLTPLPCKKKLGRGWRNIWVDFSCHIRTQPRTDMHSTRCRSVWNLNGAVKHNGLLIYVANNLNNAVMPDGVWITICTYSLLWTALDHTRSIERSTRTAATANERNSLLAGTTRGALFQGTFRTRSAPTFCYSLQGQNPLMFHQISCCWLRFQSHTRTSTCQYFSSPRTKVDNWQHGAQRSVKVGLDHSIYG